LEVYKRKRYFFCGSCNAHLREWRDLCENEQCSLYRLVDHVSIKRTKSTQRIEVHVVNIIPQLSDVLIDHVRGIIAFHRSIHEQGEGYGSHRSDVRSFDGYRAAIETRDDFNENRLGVLLSVSVDGFTPRRILRFE
ncbi:hypothetical protein ANCCAN_15917, partial [Ancylostoma caninum]